MKNTWSFRTFLIWLSIALFAYGLFLTGKNKRSEYLDVRFSDFVNDVDVSKVREVRMHHGSGEVLATYKNKTKAIVRFPEYDRDFVTRLLSNKVDIYVAPHDEFGYIFWINVLTAWLPNIVLFGLIFYAHLGGRGGAMGFGRSRAKKLSDKDTPVTFKDVAGLPEAKAELVEIVDFLKHPDRFLKLGVKTPRGVLMYGPPGTGKTLLARAIAGEAKVPFLYVSGSEFVEIFVGVGPSRVRDLFEKAKKHGRCIIFIDEMDSIGKRRNSSFSSNEERETTLMQLLVELDGFEGDSGVIVIAATNRVDVLDPALLRPGRFDRLIEIGLPDAKGRGEILRVHLRKFSVDPAGVDLKGVQYATAGFSGADLAELVNRSGIHAARSKRAFIQTEDLRKAMEEMILGAESSMVIHDDEKECTAYHEAGHALVSLHVKHSDPIFKATIIPTNKALGMVVRLPERENRSISKAKLFDNICVSMAGVVAEEVVYGKENVTTGASSDIQHATLSARRMVTKWGMSDVLGHVEYNIDSEYEMGSGLRPSPDSREKIDNEIRSIINQAYTFAKKTLEDNRDQLELIAKGLLEYETLSGSQIKHLLECGSLDTYDAEMYKSDDEYIYIPEGHAREESVAKEAKENVSEEQKPAKRSRRKKPAEENKEE